MQTCFLCEQLRPVEIRVGPFACCAECEVRIVLSQVGTDDYEEIIAGVRKLWGTLAALA